MTDKIPYLTMSELLEYVEEPNKKIANELWKVLTKTLGTAKGSSHNHQAREGGYFDHIVDACNLAKLDYDSYTTVRDLPFTLGDLILVIFLHDLEKPYTYAPHEIEKYKNLKDYELRDTVIKDRGFELTDEHRNGLIYVHGEGNDHKKTKRVQGPLAAFAHCADTKSARVDYDKPRNRAW